MDYRTPEGHILRTDRSRTITVNGVQYPSTVLDKRDLATLHQYGYRRIVYGPKADPSYYDNTPSSDISVDGQETITYTQSPRFSVAEAQARLVEVYYERTEQVVVVIMKRLHTYQATGQTAKETEWQAHFDGVRPLYLTGVAEFQRVMALPTETEQYEGLITMHQNLDSYIYQLPE